MRALRALLAGVGWALLGLAALAGLALSAAVLLASTQLARPFVASTLIRIADDALAGQFELEGVGVLPGGAIELRGLRVIDPDGHLVLAVDRARVLADVTRLRNRSIGLTVELEGASVLVEEERDGGISLARAFAPSRPSEPRAPGVEEPPGAPWRLRFQQVTLRRSDVWWVSADGETRLEAQGVDVDARGVVGPGRVLAELRLSGSLELPVEGPLSIEVRGALDERALRVGVLRVRLGDTSVDGLGEVDLATRRGRVALGRLTVDRGAARELLPQVALGADLEATAYVESDGAVATGAVHVAPPAGDAAAAGPARGGRADAAVAIRLDGTRALGADVAVDRLDPARLHLRAPPGAVTLTARGGAAGDALETLRGRVAVSLARSRLRGAELGPGELSARADRGRWEVQRLALSAPGLTARGAGTWRQRGAVAGKVALEATDLGRALENVGRLLDERLPALGGRVKLDGALSGTAAAPVLDARVDAPSFAVGGLAWLGLRGEGRISGPLRAPTARLDAAAARVRQGGRDVARALRVRGELTGAEARLEASADVPALGRDPVTLQAVAQRAAEADELVLTELSLAYPGTRFALEGSARLSLSGPRVDRLALAAGAQRITAAGGLGARGALDARLVLERVRLEGLPAGILPAEERLGGEVSAELSASGTTRRPVLAGRLALSDGRWRTLEGLRAQGELRWDGGGRRATAAVALAREAGGTADVQLDLPVPLGVRPREPVSARLRAEALPLDALLAAARLELPAAGALSLEATLSGTSGAPALEAQATLADGTYQDLTAVGLTLRAEAPGERLVARVEARLSGQPAVRAEAAVPLDLSDLLARPAATLRAVRRAPVEGGAEIPALDLALLAGRLGLPERLAGRLLADVRLEGTLAAPRGAGAVELRGAAIEGYTGLSARVDLTAEPERVALAARAGLDGEEVLRLTGSLGAPLERLAGRAGLRAAPLALEAVVPRVSLARTSTAALLVEGTLEGRLTVEGTASAPRLALDLKGERLAIQGRPLGELAARARWAGPRGTAALTLSPTSGGAVEAALSVELPASIDLRAAAVRAAPAELTVRARALDLGFLPAAAPGTVREASGKLEADVAARGPLARLTPRGSLRVTDGRVAVSEYGDWSEIQVDATVTEDAVEITRLAARRGRGALDARGSLRGLASGQGRLEGRLTTRELSIMRAGMDLATLDLEVGVTGGYRARRLDVELRIPRGTVRLPKRPPRTLQSLERRKDILIGRDPERRPVTGPPREPGAAPGPAPLHVVIHAIAPGRLMVVSDNPRIRLELKADVTFELRGSEQYATGRVEVVRGDVEPIGGRNFQVKHAEVTFTGGPPAAAILDVEAIYEHPSAVVTALVTGPLRSPEFGLTSQPPMDEAQIAMLIATGSTELKPGTGGVGTLTGEEAGKAALGALATQVFKNLVADKLPLDTVALDSSAIRAGKYVTDRIYVGYTRRFEVQPDQGENLNEVRVEYQITPHWTFESRYGDAQSGGASLIWSKNY